MDAAQIIYNLIDPKVARVTAKAMVYYQNKKNEKKMDGYFYIHIGSQFNDNNNSF